MAEYSSSEFVKVDAKVNIFDRPTDCIFSFVRRFISSFDHSNSPIGDAKCWNVGTFDTNDRC